MVIANLIFLGNTPIPGLKMQHLEENFIPSCLCCWYNGLTERRLPMQCTIKPKVYANKPGKIKSGYNPTYRQKFYHS